jgi:lysophospholipid acyltransferase (LPLAT)-like uncharacterized protein
MSERTVVARVGSTVEAQLIAGMLESYGIEAIVSADDGGGTEPQWQLTSGVRVLVAEGDAPEAERLIAEAETSS